MDRMPGEPLRLVVALGGNAILRRGDSGGIEEQFLRADAVMRHVADIVERGHRLILTHGNGPIVGNIVARNECARGSIPPMPLFIDDADSAGGIGLLLQMTLHNRLRERRLARAVVSVVTQVVVDAHDPAFAAPDKPIGPHLSPSEVFRIAVDEPAWSFAEQPDGTFRRVVPSPKPLRVVEAPTVMRLAEHGDIVIAAGGGGVPVVEDALGALAGVDAVIDKDRTSALLAVQTGAHVLAILMEEDAVYLGYGTREARRLGRVPASALREHLEAGAFAAGSMAPKVEAACEFVERGGRESVICRAEDVTEALAGRAGTHVVAG